MIALLRWIAFLAALALALAGLSTVAAFPTWVDWEYRLRIAAFEGEQGYQFALTPLALVLVAWAVRRDHRALTALTVCLSLAASGLMLNPVIRAWWIARSLPAQLAQAYGPAKLDFAAFSFATLYAPLPPAVSYEEISFSGPLILDLYHPVGRTTPAPCVLILHGGGWYAGNHRDRRPFTHWLARQGYAVATIDYRLIPQATWPAQHEDVLAAITFLQKNASLLGIDARRLVLLGRSAGGQLATTAAYPENTPALSGVISFYGPADLRTLWQSANNHDRLNGWTWRELLQTFLRGTPETAPKAFDSASAVTRVDSKTPPTLLIHGQLDSLVSFNQSEALAAALTRANRPHTLVSIPWAPHSFDTVNFNGPGSQLSNYAVAWFLATVTR